MVVVQKEFCLICGFSTVRKKDLDDYGHCFDRSGCERRKKSKEICEEMELTEGMKFDKNKIRLELLSPWFVEEVGKVLTSGAHKYADHNWAKGIKASRLIGASLRHIFAYMKGEVNDPEWNYHHLAHAACCLMFLVHQDLTDFYKAYNDIPKWDKLPNE